MFLVCLPVHGSRGTCYLLTLHDPILLSLTGLVRPEFLVPFLNPKRKFRLPFDNLQKFVSSLHWTDKNKNKIK